MNTCQLGVDMLGGTGMTAIKGLGKQTVAAVGTGSLADMCHGKTAQDILRGVPGNVVGSVADGRAAAAGVGDIGQGITAETWKEFTNKVVNTSSTPKK